MPTTGARRRALYICYLSIDEPLVETQVIAYLRGLTAAGHEMHLLTFDTRSVGRRQRRARRQALLGEGIMWHRLQYHKRLSLVATAFDVTVGTLVALGLCVRHRLTVVHARNHVPGAMALVVCGVLRGRHLVFDVRGVMAEEYEDAGIWKRDSVAFRVTKWVERRCLEKAAGVVVLTERIRRQLLPGPDERNVQVIPSCADVSAIAAAGGRRDELRSRLRVDSRTVLLYVGKFGGWYMTEEMVDFFATARSVLPGLFFLVLTQSERARVTNLMATRGLTEAEFAVTRVLPSDVPAYLSVGDCAISLIRPSPSKVSSSPTKIAEYLAAGLPVVSTSGVGDVDGVLARHRTGVLLSDLSPDGYLDGARRLEELMNDDGLADRCRLTARETSSLENVGVPRYRALYEGLDRVDAAAR
jgi:glycosyltransferase involved in cell wall biosynthesis